MVVSYNKSVQSFLLIITLPSQSEFALATHGNKDDIILTGELPDQAGSILTMAIMDPQIVMERLKVELGYMDSDLGSFFSTDKPCAVQVRGVVVRKVGRQDYGVIGR